MFEFLQIMNFEHETQDKFHIEDELDDENDLLKEIERELDN